MANNFAEAFLGARNSAQDRQRQQEADAQARQMQAFEFEQAQQKASLEQQDRSQNQLLGMARGWKTVQPQNRQAYYERFIKPAITQQFGDPGPYDEAAVNSVADQILAAYTPVGSSELAPRVVGKALVDSTGKVLYQAPEEAPKPIWDSARGVFIQQPTGGVSRQDMEGDIALANELIAAGVPDAQVDAFLKSRGERQQPTAIPVAGVSPKDTGPEETFSQPQPVTYPDGSVRLVQFGNRGSRREVEGVAPPPTDRNAKPPTEGEKSAAGYLQRMVAAEDELSSIERRGYRPGGIRDYFTAGQGMANFAATPLGQEYRQQQEDWVRAKLRKESGAVIGDEEMEREISVYFPQPGDGEGVRRQKAASRQKALRQMEINAGRAASAADAPAAPASNGGWSIQRVD